MEGNKESISQEETKPQGENPPEVSIPQDEELRDLEIKFRFTEDEARKLNLFQKLVEIRRSCAYLQKSNQGHKFKYVGSSQVLGAFRKAMDYYGVVLVPHVMKTEVSDHTTKAGDHRYFTEIWMKYVWLNADKPEELLEVQWYGQGIDDGEKGPGKAYTYAEKYMMLKIFQVATDKDDPDNFQNPPGNGNGHGNPPSQRQKNPPRNQSRNQQNSQSGKPPGKSGNGKDPDENKPAGGGEVKHLHDVSAKLRQMMGESANDWLKKETKKAGVKFDKDGEVKATKGQVKMLWKTIRDEVRSLTTIRYREILDAFRDKNPEGCSQVHKRILEDAAKAEKKKDMRLETMSLATLEKALGDITEAWHKEVNA